MNHEQVQPESSEQNSSWARRHIRGLVITGSLVTAAVGAVDGSIQHINYFGQGYDVYPPIITGEQANAAEDLLEAHEAFTGQDLITDDGALVDLSATDIPAGSIGTAYTLLRNEDTQVERRNAYIGQINSTADINFDDGLNTRGDFDFALVAGGLLAAGVVLTEMGVSYSRKGNKQNEENPATQPSAS